MEIFWGIIGLMFLLVVFGCIQRVRQTKMIRAAIEARGGKVVDNSHIAINQIRPARYADHDGAIYQASFKTYFNSVELIEEVPIENILRRERDKIAARRDRKDKEVNLDELIIAVEKSKLMPVRATNLLILELVNSPHDSREIHEGEFNQQYGKGFGCIVQGMTIQSIGSEDKPLELMINGKSVNLTWSVTGEKPNRVLRLELDRNVPQDGETNKAFKT